MALVVGQPNIIIGASLIAISKTFQFEQQLFPDGLMMFDYVSGLVTQDLTREALNARKNIAKIDTHKVPLLYYIPALVEKCNFICP